MIKEFLGKVPLFAALEDAQLDRVADLASVKGFMEGTPLFAAGDPSDCFYVIARGRVQIGIPARTGVPAREISLGTGKFFGEMGVLRGTPRMADAVVEEDAVLIRVGQAAFDNLMAVDDDIAERVMVAYMSRAAEVEETQRKAQQASQAAKPSQAEVKDPKVFLFFSAGGGAGASFLVANMAIKARDLTRKKVLVLDLDTEAPTQHLYLGAPNKPGALPQLLAEQEAGTLRPERLVEVAVQLHTGVDLIGGPGVPLEAKVTPKAITDLLAIARKAYDYVLVDTVSADTELNDALFQACDVVQVVFGPDLVSIARSLPVVKGIQDKGLDARLRLVLNKFTPEVGIKPELIEDRFGRPVLGRVEFSHEMALEAINEGVPLVKRNPRSAVAADLMRFTRQTISRPTGDARSAPGGFSLWNIFG